MESINRESLPDAIALWNSLRDFLKVDVTVLNLPERPESSSPVTVVFTITNIAPREEDYPEIVFEEVRLDSSTRGDISSGRISGELQSGQSCTYELRVDYHQLASLDVHVRADVSRRRYFQTSQRVSLPVAYTKPTMLAFFKAFNGVEIHNPLGEAMGLEMPGPDSTLASLQMLGSQLQEVINNAESIRESLNSTYRELGISGRQIQDHVKAAYQYLSTVGKYCQELSNAISTHDSQRIEEAALALTTLESEAMTINSSTEEMMSKYQISDREAGYRYREWNPNNLLA